jgi:hypothetical protein
MKTEAMAVLVLARQKAKASNVKPVWVTLPKPTKPCPSRRRWAAGVGAVQDRVCVVNQEGGVR